MDSPAFCSGTVRSALDRSELRAALAARYAEAAVGYEATKAKAEGLVAEWRWSRGLSRWDDPRPLAAEREGERRGRLLRSRPTSRFRDQDQVGLDDAGRAVVVRDHDGLGGLVQETFLMPLDGRLERTAYRPPSAIGP